MGLFDNVGVEGTACLRLAFAELILLVVARPRLRIYDRDALRAAVALGVVTAAVTMFFLGAGRGRRRGVP